MNGRIAQILRDCLPDKPVLVPLILVAGICFAVNASLVGAQTAGTTSTAAEHQLPEGKQTTLGLYVTAQEAYEMWQAAPEKVTVIDVRTPEEFALIGHAEMAWNIPLRLHHLSES